MPAQDRLTLAFNAQMEYLRHSSRLSRNSLYPDEDLEAIMTNHELSGIANWMDLDDDDCQNSYKNEFELDGNFVVTRSGIMELYES